MAINKMFWSRDKKSPLIIKTERLKMSTLSYIITESALVFLSILFLWIHNVQLCLSAILPLQYNLSIIRVVCRSPPSERGHYGRKLCFWCSWLADCRWPTDHSSFWCMMGHGQIPLAEIPPWETAKADYPQTTVGSDTARILYQIMGHVQIRLEWRSHPAVFFFAYIQ